MFIVYKEFDSAAQSAAKAKQGAQHLDNAVCEVSAAFDLLWNSDRASNDDEGALAQIHTELKAIKKRVEARLSAATPALEATSS